MNLLSNILIEPQVLTQEAIQELINHAKQSSTTDLSVFDPDKTNETGETSWIVDKDIRDTQIIEFGDLYPKIEDLFKNIVKHVINPFYNAEVWDSEVPQFLSYKKEGHYAPHIDGRSIWVAPNGDKIWRKSTDRDLSAIIFCNDGNGKDFDGGNFIFPELGIEIPPKAGTLVCFPSDQNYLHGVKSVEKIYNEKGKEDNSAVGRLAIVTWMRIKGQKTKEQEDKELLEKYGVN
jgi:predicted 2-oxoglutarate/Fe(II)-dependent dioxygenase YbiX